ncbi:MAG: hypothetical protein JWN70_437 [Planctomycetaceae bacterium]|nr:hypothetical protein [Planctomycetaceae bacterium]
MLSTRRAACPINPPGRPLSRRVATHNTHTALRVALQLINRWSVSDQHRWHSILGREST